MTEKLKGEPWQKLMAKRLLQGSLNNPGLNEDKDEIDKTTQHMKAIKEAKEVAEEISGAGELRKKIEESEKARKKTEAELAEERQRQLQEQIKNLQTEITKLFDQRGSNPEVTKLMQQLEATKNELIQTRFDYLDKQIRELSQMKAAGASQQTLDQQIKQIKAAVNELGLQAPAPNNIPPELQIQLKQMDVNLQLQIEQMKDERDRRDKEWQLTIKKWEEEKEQKERELASKVSIEKEKMELVSDFIKRMGSSFAKGILEAGQQGGAIGGQVASQAIQAIEGEFGEIPCPNCSNIIPIARDAIKAICPGCASVYPIQRLPKEVAVEPETESEGTD